MRLKKFLGSALQLGQTKRPSDAPRKEQGARCCGHMVNYIHVLHTRYMNKIDRREGEEGPGGGGSK